jgi:isopentenyldiphosphate isomerase
MTRDPGDELVDIVDDGDRVIGVATRRAVRARVLKHRCVSIVVRSSAGAVLIHRRSERKDLWPGFWDFCAGGVLAAGEGWEDGARRELAEELGVAGDLTAVGAGTYRDAQVDEIARLYSVTHDGPFAFSDGEVVEAFFVTLEDLASRIARDRFVPDSVALVWPLIRS